MVEQTNITTVKLDKKTKTRLDKLKTHKRESYDELLQNILNILNICKVNPEQARSRLRQIDKIQTMIKETKVGSSVSS